MIEFPDRVALFVEPCFLASATKASNSAIVNLFEAVSSDAFPTEISSINSFSNSALCLARRLTKRRIIISVSSMTSSPASISRSKSMRCSISAFPSKETSISSSSLMQSRRFCQLSELIFIIAKEFTGSAAILVFQSSKTSPWFWYFSIKE